MGESKMTAPDLADKIATRLQSKFEIHSRCGESVPIEDIAKVVKRAIEKERRRRNYEQFIPSVWSPEWQDAIAEAYERGKTP
jgi:hypothetical protein